MKQTNNEIQHDEELYDMLVETRQAMTFDKKDEEIGMPDIDEEWKKFSSLKEVANGSKETAQKPSHSLRRLIKPQAAAVIGFIFLTGISFAAINYFSKGDDKHHSEKPTLTVKKASTSAAKESGTLVVKPVKAEPVIFQNVELQKILETISSYYKVRVEYKNIDARKVRFYLQWDKEEGLNALVDKLNHFEKVHITLDSEGNILTVE
jgi:hypothetical protein